MHRSHNVFASGWQRLSSAGRGAVRRRVARGIDVLRDRRGNALVEVALVFPILVLLLIGGVEMARYILLAQKLDKAAVTVADLVAQEKELTEGQLSDLFTSVNFVLDPYAINSNGAVFISSVKRNIGDATPRVAWQRKGVGTMGVSSTLGPQNQPATLPASMSLREDESVIIAEVFYQFTPFWAPEIVAPGRLFFQAAFRPRRSIEVELK
jgi:Flp pilus assembly protein TadG